MCLGVPGKIIKKWKDDKSGLAMAQVDFGGIKKEVCLALNSDARAGDYVVVHVGFAISQIDQEEARQALEFLNQTGRAEEELGQTI